MVNKAKILLYMIALIFGISLLLPSNVETVEAASPKLSKSSVTLTKGKNTTITIKNNDGKTINWFTANKSVASIKKLSNTEVCITAKETGSTDITAFDYTNGKLYRCNVTVEAPKISKKSATITKDETVTVKLNGTTRNATWKTSNKSVATIKKTSKNTFRITGKKNGTAKITAKLNGIIYTCTIKVTVEKPSINKKSTTITKSKSTTVKLNNTTQNATWATSNKSVATIRKTAKNTYIVTGIKSGTSKITAKLKGVTYTCTVKVEAPSLSVTTKSISTNNGFNLAVRGTSKTVAWKSDNSAVASVTKVNSYLCIVSTKKDGIATITATVDGISLKCKVIVGDGIEKVVSPPVAISELNTTVSVNGGIVLTCSKFSATEMCSWSILDESITKITGRVLGDGKKDGSSAYLDSIGYGYISIQNMITVRGLKPGTTTVSVTNGWNTYTGIITVIKPQLSTDHVAIEYGKSATLTIAVPSSMVSQWAVYSDYWKSAVSKPEGGRVEYEEGKDLVALSSYGATNTVTVTPKELYSGLGVVRVYLVDGSCYDCYVYAGSPATLANKSWTQYTIKGFTEISGKTYALFTHDWFWMMDLDDDSCQSYHDFLFRNNLGLMSTNWWWTIPGRSNVPDISKVWDDRYYYEYK